MVESKQIQKGFKDTEVGIIPNDWEITVLDKICTKIGDGLHSTPNYSENGYYSFINGNNLNNGKIVITDTTKKVSKEEYLKHKIALNTNSILLSINGTIGNAAIYNNENVILGKSAAYINLNDNAEKKLIYQLIQSKYIQIYFENELTGSTIKNLGLSSLRNTPLLLPPTIAEQKAIATALNDTDELISKIEKLIDKKRAINQGAMQELLKPKEEWEKKLISSITLLMTNGFVGAIKSHYTDYDNGVLYIQGYNVEENSFNFNGIKRVTNEFHKQHLKSCLQEGDLLTIQTGDIGTTTIVPKKLVGANCHALIITRFKRELVDSLFYSYYFNYSDGRNQLKEIETGSTMKHINVGDMAQLIVPYPPKEEQTRIAQILSDMVSEIDVLEKKLDKLQNLKQGMMQNLLTGKIRLI